MVHKSFQQWCHFIAHQMPGMDLSLDRIRKVANNMGLLPQECPVITVGGTNGKGSCVLTLEYLYHRAGYHTLSFLSPAVQSPCEQFRYQSQNITENQLIDCWQHIVNAQSNIPLSQFEFKTLSALILAKTLQVDVLILEVGLGGQDDAVNIVDADVAILTHVGHDHIQFLGTCPLTRGRIKAGIFRAHCPAIVAQTNPPQTVVDRAHEIDAQLILCPKNPPPCEHPTLSANLAWAARQAIACLHHRLPIDPSIAIDNMVLPYRCQSIDRAEHTIILDTAHNADAALHLRHTLVRQYPGIKFHAIFSCLADKSPTDIIQAMHPIIQHWHVSELSGDRACPLNVLENSLKTNQVAYTCYPSIAHAEAGFTATACQNTIGLVFGSFNTLKAFLAAHTTTETCI